MSLSDLLIWTIRQVDSGIEAVRMRALVGVRSAGDVLDSGKEWLREAEWSLLGAEAVFERIYEEGMRSHPMPPIRQRVVPVLTPLQPPFICPDLLCYEEKPHEYHGPLCCKAPAPGTKPKRVRKRPATKQPSKARKGMK